MRLLLVPLLFMSLFLARVSSGYAQVAYVRPSVKSGAPWSSGVFLGKADGVGILITADHVLNYGPVSVSNGSEFLLAKVLWRDGVDDIALLSIPWNGKVAVLADESPQAGESVSMSGATSGVVQGRVHGYDKLNIMVGLHARNGDSGAPFFDSKMRVVGILSAEREEIGQSFGPNVGTIKRCLRNAGWSCSNGVCNKIGRGIFGPTVPPQSYQQKPSTPTQWKPAEKFPPQSSSIVPARPSLPAPTVSNPLLDLDALAARIALKIPKPKDGKDGLNGKDGRDGLDASDYESEIASLKARIAELEEREMTLEVFDSDGGLIGSSSGKRVLRLKFEPKNKGD